LGYIKCPDDVFVSLKAMRNLSDEKVLILTTGSQGEPLAALTRISNGQHPHIRVQKGDTVVFSANPIPGNTIAVVNTIDRLMMQGAEVIYGRHQGIHVSGHGCQEEHKLMLALTRPKFFIPIHGEHRMLLKHAQTAHSMGVPTENMVIIKNGDIVEVSPDNIDVLGQVPSGIELVDQAGVVHDHVMHDRQQLAEEGIVTVATAINWQGKLMAKPEVHLRGVVTKVEQSLLEQLIIRAIERILSERWDEFSHDDNRSGIGVNWKFFQEEIETTLQRLVRRELRSQPMVVFLLQTPEEPEPGERPVTKTYRRRRSTASAIS
jgi:ribonuclease J